MNAAPGLGEFAAVGIGCGLGAVVRFEVSRRLAGRFGDAFPWATLAVNLSGCLLAGFALMLLATPSSSAWALLLTAGLLGGYTTVSSFSLETLLLFQRGHSSAALAYLAASMLGCLAATGLGAGLGRLWLDIGSGTGVG
ncbi:MAG: fluoride efflux transporter CrcB [Wenzhouxiangellaceae bacterium]|nr:fluoride efflux transporter CrcB [Wenzhouxiangellaceae bacterium]